MNYNDFEEWKSLRIFKNSNPSDVLRWFKEVCKRYEDEPQRKYHKLSHIRSMLNLIQQHLSLLHNLDAVKLATWFHDVVYDPKRNDNEEKSAEVFKEFSHDFNLTSTDLETEVYSMIIATKTHNFNNENHYSQEWVDDILFVLDIDLSILASEDYAIYSRQIREEYSHVSEHDYIIGRSTVLQSFLNSPNNDPLFHSQCFKQLENKARLNMNYELNQLSSISKST